MRKGDMHAAQRAPEQRVSRLHNVPTPIVRMIVRLIADGRAESPAEAAETIAKLKEASRLTRDAAVGMVGYVMSLAPVRALPTATMLRWMRHAGFADEVVRTARQSRNGALMSRIADLAADPTAGEVVDALHGRLVASLRGATVNGEPMYSSDDAEISALATEVIRRLKPDANPRPYEKVPHWGTFDLHEFTVRFLRLDRPERKRHLQRYGPMCNWDVSQVETFSHACSFEGLTFNSDLYWDTSAATSMHRMFYANSEFRGDLSTWDVSKVHTMSSMFQGAGIVDSGIGRWDVGSLRDAGYMFAKARFLSPQLDLARWNMSECTDLTFMFAHSAVKDNGIGKWKLDPSANTLSILRNARAFAGALPGWSEAQRAISGAGAQQFGATPAPKGEDELIADLFVDARRHRPAESSCAVQ
jgi:surface protein